MNGTPLVFISYRSHDEPSMAYLLYREVTDRFGEHAAFRDSDSISAGTDFEPEILNAVRGCAVLLVVIGSNWLYLPDGQRRALDEPDDWVRREIIEALRQGVRVVPVLAGDTPAPAASDLPGSIQVITRHQFVRIRHRHERDDINSLLDELVAGEPRLLARDLGATVPPATPPDRLDAAAKLLAAQVFQQASDAVQSWQLDTPKVVTRWRLSIDDYPQETVDDWASGEAHSIAKLAAVVRGLPRKRLALLGEGGCGKTSLAMLLIRQLAGNHRAGDRVPVLVPLAGWDPDVESSHAWLISRLVKDYPALRAAEFGKDAAGALVRQRRVLAVFDGLDELPPDTQRRAMRVLSQLTENDAWLVTSRTEAFANLPATHRAGVDATMTAQPLSPREAHTYLHRMVRDDERWQPVLTELADESDTPLAKALRTPLTLWLVSQTYVDTPADPVRLTTFADPEQVHRHLLTQLVPSVLAARLAGDSPFHARHRWPADRAHHWLTTLARSLTARGTTELAWWQLNDLGPRHPRAVLAAMLAVATGLAAGGAGLLTPGGQRLGIAAAATLLIAAAAVFCTVERPPPAFASFQPRQRVRQLLGHLAKGATAGLLLGGLFLLVADSLQSLLLPLTPVAAFTTGAGLGLGVGFFRWAGVATRLDEARTPAKVLRDDRRLTLLVAGTVAAALCALSTYALGTAMGSEGFVMGAAMLPVWAIWAAFGAVTPGETRHRMTGYAWPGYVLSVTWAAAAGRLPWRLMPFLEDMHRLGILTQVGAVYQFRHADVRDVLAESHPGG